MGSLLGSAPKATFSTQPTIDPTQQGLMSFLTNLLQTGTPPPGVESFQNPANPPTYSAPLSSLQNSSLAALSGIPAGAEPTAAQGQTTSSALDWLQQAFGYQAPQFAAPTIPSAGAATTAGAAGGGNIVQQLIQALQQSQPAATTAAQPSTATPAAQPGAPTPDVGAGPIQQASGASVSGGTPIAPAAPAPPPGYTVTSDGYWQAPDGSLSPPPSDWSGSPWAAGATPQPASASAPATDINPQANTPLLPEAGATGAGTPAAASATAGTGSLQALIAALSGTGAPGGAQTTPTTSPGALQTPPLINSAQAFQQGVAAPLIQDFQQQVIPTLEGAIGQSAGGAYGSSAQQAGDLATQNLGRTLAQQGTLYDLGAQQANQGVLQGTNLANLQAILSTQQANQSAGLQGQGLGLQALGLTPSVVGAQQAPYANAANILASTLQSGGVPQQQQQAQITGEYQNYLSQLQQAQTLLQLMAGTSTAPTQQTIGVGTGGSSGLLSGLLGSSGVTNAIGSGITSLFSDRRLKTDIERVGELDNELPVYTFRYRGDPAVRLGLMADDVEKVKPEAVVTTPSGYKAVNYALAALEDL